MALLKWEISDMINIVSVAFNEIANYTEVWEMNVDWKYGMCYTFDPKRHGYETMPIKDVYDSLSSIFIGMNVRIINKCVLIWLIEFV